LLVTKYKIPTIFICQKWILQTNYEKHEFIGYGKIDDKFAFILLPGFRPENVPNYKFIQSDTNDIFISLDKLNADCLESLRNEMNRSISIETFLENFSKPVTKYEKKKPTKLVIELPNKLPAKKKLIIVDETNSISPEEYIIVPKKKQTRKKIEIKGQPKTKKNKKKLTLIIEEEDKDKLSK
jgi:hypothetical protein